MNAKDSRHATGARAEQHAADYLTAKGYHILSRNWRCRSGELDIVASSNGIVVIVEVRSRRDGSGGRFGHPLESVERRKQAQVRRTAAVYLQQAGSSGLNVSIRFDVISVVLHDDGTVAELCHVPQAF